MKIKLNINDRAALAIKKGEKKVEIRANKEDSIHDYSKLKNNDIIEFNSNSLGIFYTKVNDVNHYDTLDELFELEGTKYTTSSTNDKGEAIKSINSLEGYKDAIERNGVYAIHIEYLYSENTVWKDLYEKCKSVLNGRALSDSVEAGGVAAAILTEKGNIYTGVCIDTACSLGFCSERNAIGNMITNGEEKIQKLVCIGSHNDNIMMPCGACRELMLQLSDSNKNMQILTNFENKDIVTLKELMPRWWK